MSTPSLPGVADRDSTLDRAERETFDLAVIGGGITGAGIAREAALRGLSVALLEARDFASGTSSRSSKLIHGGLRYLAMGDVALVRSSALERKVIHRLAPHLAEPRWMVVPARSWAGLAKLRAGITTYEKLGDVEPQDLHQNWGRDEMEQGEPLLSRERFAHACVYREYLTDDARLVVANLRAAAAAGALVLNHSPVSDVTESEGRADGVAARCSLTGREFRVRARCVINAAGPWVDAVRGLEDEATKPRLMLSKGVHIVVPAERLAVRNLVILNTDDKRSIFVIRRGRAVYIGTTDTFYEGDNEEWPEITREDVEYLLRPVARDFTAEPIAPEEITSAWAGLRPLIGEKGKSPSEISRKDEVWIGPKGVVSIAGGKLTGYRPMAEMTLDKVAEVSGLTIGDAPENPPLPGGDFGGDLEGLAAGLRGHFGDLSDESSRRLARLYGSEAEEVVSRGAAPLTPGALPVVGELDWATNVEGAAKLRDFLYRRAGSAYYEVGDREGLVDAMARSMGERLGWDEAKVESEAASSRAQLARDVDFKNS